MKTTEDEKQMKLKNMYENTKKHLGKIVLIPFIVGIISGCGGQVEKQIYSGEIKGKKIAVYNIDGKGFLKYDGTKIVISDKSGNMEKILYDHETGVLGDEYYDYFKIYQKDGKFKTYSINYYINEEGQKISFDSDMSKEIKSLILDKFKDYDKEYQEIKQNVLKSIKERL